MNYSNEMHREIILDHIQNPRNKKETDDTYLKAYLKNPSCGDDVFVHVLIDNNIVKDIGYDVNGCSICKASTSIMSELLIGKTKEEANYIIDNINNMLTSKKYDSSILMEANCFEGVKNLPPRIKCVLLPYKAYKRAIGEENGM